MAANDLNASLTLKSTQFETALARADAKATAFANKVKGQLSAKIATMFGGAAIVATVQNFATRLFGRAEEVAKLSKEYKITTTEVQLLQRAAKDAGLTFSEYMSEAKKGAIDLAKTLSDIRKSGAVDVISQSAIEAMNANRKRLQGAGQGAVDTGVSVLGEGLNAGKQLLGGNFKEAGKSAYRAWLAKNQLPYKLLGMAVPNMLQDGTAEQPSGISPGLLPGGKPPALEASPIVKHLNRSGPGQGVNELQKIGAAVGGTANADQNLFGILRHTEQQTRILMEIEKGVKAKPFGSDTLTGGPWL